MKINKYLLVLFSVYLSSCQSQEKKQLIAIVDDSKAGIEALINFSNIAITAATDKNFDATDEMNFDDLMRKKVSDTSLTKFFNNLSLTNDLAYPYNLIALDKDEFKFVKLIGEDNFYFSDNADMKPIFKPTKFVFLDGTEAIAAENFISEEKLKKKYGKNEIEDGKTYFVVDEEKMTPIETEVYKASGFNANFALMSPKPLQSVSYQIEVPVSTKTNYPVDAKTQNVTSQYGDIKLDSIVGNKVFFNLPKTPKDDDIQIIAYYKDGRILKNKGTSRNTYISPQQEKVYLKYLDILDSAKEKINKGEIKTKIELEKWLQKNSPFAANNGLNNERQKAIYTFAGPVNKISFSVRDSVKNVKRFNTTYKINYSDEEQSYFTSLDFETKKIGLLNKAGKWVIKPQFDENFRIQNRYFYWDQLNDNVNTFWLDHKTETIHKVPYLIDGAAIYDGKYVKIQKQVNGPRGIVDALTGKIILPMEYDQLNFESNKFWVGEKNEKDGIYDRNFKLLLPFNYENIVVEGNYFFTMENGDRTNAFDANGTNLTKDKFNIIKGTYTNGLLLVRTQEERRKGYLDNIRYFFVDQSNNIKINATAKGFEDPEPFSAGMAVVQNKDSKKGYINTVGNLVVPCKYSNAGDFYPTSQLAFVQTDYENYALINKQGKVIKKFDGNVYKTENKPEKGASRIYFKNDKIYNEFGEEAKDNPRR